MRGSDGYSEQLFTQIRLEEFVLPTHPLSPIRQWVNEVLASMNERFNAMYEVDIKGLLGLLHINLEKKCFL